MSDQLTEFLKTAEDMETNKDDSTAVGGTNLYKDPPGIPEANTEPVRFSNTAQESSKDVREGVPGRLLSSPTTSNAAQRALIGAVLKEKDFETSNIQIKPVEKVSHPRSQTLLEQTLGKLGRV